MNKLELLSLSADPSWPADPSLAPWMDSTVHPRASSSSSSNSTSGVQHHDRHQELGRPNHKPAAPACPIARLPIDILLYIASPRFLTLNDIVQWRTSAPVFYNSIPLPDAAMILQAAFLFQVRPQRGERDHLPSSSSSSSFPRQHPFYSRNSSAGLPSAHVQPPSPPWHSALPYKHGDLYSTYITRELKDIMTRLTRLLCHPDFHPRLLRSSYSFRHSPHHPNTTYMSQKSQFSEDTGTVRHRSKRSAKRTRRDLQDYPIFLTGNPPDLVRLAIEFGHIPFVDHLLNRGFRPRDLPEYFSMIPFMPLDPIELETPPSEQNLAGTVNGDSIDSGEDGNSVRFKVDHEEQAAVLMKRSMELSQIWECMRVANQELMEASSRADLEAVLKVLDATLIHPRISLESSLDQEQQEKDRQAVLARSRKGKQKDDGRAWSGSGSDHPGADSDILDEDLHDSIGTGSDSMEIHDKGSEESIGAGVGGAPSRLSYAAAIDSQPERSQAAGMEDTETWSPHARSHVAPPLGATASASTSIPPPLQSAPLLIHRSSIFKARERVESVDSQEEGPPSLFAFSAAMMSADASQEETDSQSHVPWIDGRALTSALLAVCFRRDGVGSEEDQAEEEEKAVPIVNEILKYDCMLTAQALGQAVLGVVYSRPQESLKRSQQLHKEHRQQLQKLYRQQHSMPKLSIQERQAAEQSVAASAPKITVMDLLMERIGPREWLKLIKCYLQRQEFEDLAVVLERCPFKGPQLETKDKDRLSGNQQQWGERRHSQFHRHVSEGVNPPSRELICREAGICGVGTRLTQFTGRGIGQSSYHVSSTLHESSRVLFTGSGTRFNHSFMLPRGGFRGIGGNSSGHSGGSSGSAHVMDSVESHQAAEEASQRGQASTAGDSARQRGGRVSNISSAESRRDQSSQIREHDPVDGEYQLDEDFEGMAQGQDESQDSNLAFGGVGSSTTSSSRPGPGMVGIAIQVQAPEHILKMLLKMGFRFFSICDLSISDTRHPLALQFRQQEKMNRQLIEFCMVPNVPSLERQQQQLKRQQSFERARGGGGLSAGKQKQVESRYDLADQEFHAQVVQKFLYPAATNPARGSVSIPVLPTMVEGRKSMLESVNESEKTLAPQAAPPLQATIDTSSAAGAKEIDPHADIFKAESSGSNALCPSNRLQFVLPPMQLGESFESLASLTKFQDNRSGHLEQREGSHGKDVDRGYSIQKGNIISDGQDISVRPSSLTHVQNNRHAFAKSMPLPIRSSMIENKSVGDFLMFHTMQQQQKQHQRLKSKLGQGISAAKAHQKMVYETTRKRVREYLSSEYIDLMTVGICLYQACYHRKEDLLSVLLEHQLLIAQDALTGAVQVAGSVGWKRGLEMLLTHQGGLEAEVDPVVVTTSEHVHLGTSMKWDHASAIKLYPGTLPSPQQRQNSHRSQRQASLGARRSARVAAGGLDGLAGRGLRRHQSDGSRLSRFGAGVGGGGGAGGYVHRRASVDFTHATMFSLSEFSPESPLESTSPAHRTLSLKSKLSFLLPNLSTTFSSFSSSSNSAANQDKDPQQGSSQKDGLPVCDQNSEGPQPTVLMLSTSALWSLPSTMMMRKNRNAVVGLLAACTRNDPSLVRWLIETFADIKLVHVLQGLMIACDRGLIKVVKVLVGFGGTRESSREGQGKDSGEKPVGRKLFLNWLQSQRTRLQPLTETAAALHGQQKGKDRLDSDPWTDHRPQSDGFPFLILMESSPLFRHYYQILNSLSSCQFMSWRGAPRRPIPPMEGSSHVQGLSSEIHIATLPTDPNTVTGIGATCSFAETMPPSSAGDTKATPITLGSIPAFTPRATATTASNTAVPLRTPLDIKKELIRVLLEPVLETFGPVSVWKALARLPKDCWWPLDHDVKSWVDQEARVAMLELAKSMRSHRERMIRVREEDREKAKKLEQERLEQERRGQEKEMDDLAVMDDGTLEELAHGSRGVGRNGSPPRGRSPSGRNERRWKKKVAKVVVPKWILQRKKKQAKGSIRSLSPKLDVFRTPVWILPKVCTAVNEESVAAGDVQGDIASLLNVDLERGQNLALMTSLEEEEQVRQEMCKEKVAEQLQGQQVPSVKMAPVKKPSTTAKSLFRRLLLSKQSRVQ